MQLKTDIFKKNEPVSEPCIKFGTDGWRGVIGRNFTFANVRVVTHAVARAFESKSGSAPVVPVGYDHRFLADQFAREAQAVLSQYNFKPRVVSSAVTSPLLSFITWKERAPFGVMLTASHNPAEYCGFKVKDSFGGSISQDTVGRIEKHLSQVLTEMGPAGDGPGFSSDGKAGDLGTLEIEPVLKSYTGYLEQHIDFSLLRKSTAKVTFDAMFGPGGKITERIFKSTKSRVRLELIHNWRDALFGGLRPEPIEEYLGDLKAAVRKTRSAAGFALDGDGDRLGMVDERGVYLTPQQVFPLLLYYLAKEKKLVGRVVQAVSLGYLSERIAKDFNLPFKEVPVGFKYAAAEILKGGVILGGEESGGYGLCRTSINTPPGSILPERDGLMSALLFFEMVLRTGKKVSRLLADLQKRYGTSAFLRNDIPLERPIPDKSAFVSRVQKQFPDNWFGMKVREMKTLDGLKIVLEDGSWFLIRPSGTEPLLRTYAEFPSAGLSRKSLTRLSEILKPLT